MDERRIGGVEVEFKGSLPDFLVSKYIRTEVSTLRQFKEYKKIVSDYLKKADKDRTKVDTLEMDVLLARPDAKTSAVSYEWDASRKEQLGLDN
jgi:hypothetical protein